MSAIRRALLGWFDRHRRPLPWRRDRDPYRVWVAEVMLQQTRIAVVVPAYRRFLASFPTLARLAAASEDDVLSAWSGLGYYSRARSLHRAARQLAARGASFPDDLAAAKALPGVGDYTAAAVLSIAYGRPHAAVDGNVVRVLSRLERLQAPGARAVRRLAEDLLDRGRPGDWNQALMELGETICTPRRPRCGECPLARWCAARRQGDVERYPASRARRPTERVAVSLLVVRDRGGRLLLERGAFPYLRHMWLPLLRTERRAPARNGFTHAILHRELRVAVRAERAGAAEIRRLLAAGGGAERRLFRPEELGAIGRSSLLTKALAHVDRHHP